jgi:hypothetical protein
MNKQLVALQIAYMCGIIELATAVGIFNGYARIFDEF